MRASALAAVVAVAVAVGCADDDATPSPAAPEQPEQPEQPAPDDAGDPPDDEPDRPEHLDRLDGDAWQPLADAPVALTEVDAAAFDGELWVVGGLAADASVVDAVLVYDPVADRWRDGPALPVPLHHASLVATSDALVVIGGYRTLAFEPVAEVHVLDRGASEWRSGPALPEARGAGAGAFDGERILFGGGVGPDGLAADVWALDDLDGQWSTVGRLSVARDHLDAASDGAGTTWFLAGRELGLDRNLGTVEVVTGTTVEAIGELPTPRGGVAAFHLPDLGACLSGGEAPDRTFAEVECIDVEGAVEVLPPLQQARHGHGADVIDGVVLVALGGPEPMLAVSASLEALRP